MELTGHAEVFDRAAPTYDRVGVDFFAVFGQRLVELTGVGAGESVLDIGTGRGAVLGPAAAAVGPRGRAVGLDLAPAMVALTTEDFADHDHVEVHHADAAAIPADLGRFDAVLSSLVLFFLDDPARALARWGDHVAADGRLGLVTFILDPDDEWFHQLVQTWLPPQEDAPPAPEGPSSFELVRDPAWLDRALADAGFGIIEASTLRHPVHFADIEQWMAWLWSHGARAALELLPVDRFEAFKAAAGEALDARRLPGGQLGLHVTVRFTIARRRTTTWVGHPGTDPH